MKVSDILKLLFGDLDREVEDANLESSKLNNVKNDLLGVNTEDVDTTKKLSDDDNVEDTTKLEEDTEDMAFRFPKHNSDTGLFDLEGLDGEALEYFKSINDTVTNKTNQALIDKAVSDKISSAKLHKGISADFIKKNMDLSGVSVKDGKVVGVDEAFTALQKEQSGLFVAERKESSPLLEGYNPIKSSSYDMSGLSITEAMNLEQQGL